MAKEKTIQKKPKTTASRIRRAKVSPEEAIKKTARKGWAKEPAVKRKKAATARKGRLPKKVVTPKPKAVGKTSPFPKPITTTAEDVVAQIAGGQPEKLAIEESKFEIGVLHNAHAIPLQEIPVEYNKNKVTLLVVDPRFAFAYWEVRHDSLMEASQRLGPNAKLTLRFYDTTISHAPAASPFWDIEVFDRLGNWYLKLEHAEQRLCIDIGMKGTSGEFLCFARSNVMRLPPASLARPGPIRWMVVTPSGDRLVSDAEEYTEADLALLKKILGPYFFDLLMRGRFASIAGSSLEAIFYDISALRAGAPPGESPSSPLAWAKP